MNSHRIFEGRTMSVSDLRTDWHGPAACRISSSVKLHFARLCEASSCTPRAFGVSLVREASSTIDVVSVRLGVQCRKKFGGNQRFGSGESGLVGGVKLFG
jgi:hypothetical protein